MATPPRARPPRPGPSRSGPSRPGPSRPGPPRPGPPRPQPKPRQPRLPTRENPPPSPAQVATPPEPSNQDDDSKADIAVGQFEPQTMAIKRNDPSNRDTGVIMVLFIWEGIMIFIETWKHRFVGYAFDDDQLRAFEKATGMLFMTVSCCFTIVVACVLTFVKQVDRFRFLILLVGLCGYSFTAIFGIIVYFVRSLSLSIMISWLQILWTMVHPLRYWYIYHQKFPLTVAYTRFYVTMNSSVIFLALYMNGDPTEKYQDRTFLFVWSIMFIVIAGWLFLTFRMWALVNDTPGDFESVRTVYETAELIDNFNERKKNWFFFPLLLVPALIYPALFIVAGFGYSFIGISAVNRDSGILSYRLDMLFAIISIIIAEVVYLCAKKIRDEITDVIIIGIAHLLNIAVFIYLYYILSQCWNQQTLWASRPGLARLDICSDKNTTPFFIFARVGRWEYGYGDLRFFVPIAGKENIRIRIADEDGRVRIDTVHTIEEKTRSISNFFNVRLDNHTPREIAKVKLPDVHLAYNPRGVIISGSSTCTLPSEVNETIGYHDIDTTGGAKYSDLCIPIGLEYSVDHDPSGAHFFMKNPLLNESSKVLHSPCREPGIAPDEFCGTFRIGYRKLNYYMQYPGYKKLGETFRHVYPMKYNFKSHMYFVARIGSRFIPEQGGPLRHAFMLTTPRDKSENVLIFSIICHGMSLGLATVGYLHFIWMNLPAYYRMPIIFAIFSTAFILGESTRISLKTLMAPEALLFMILTILCFLWHVSVGAWFIVKVLKQPKPKVPRRV